jgi:predicted phosphodiesterase
MFLERRHILFYKDHVLVIADCHIPFEHKHYLEFCLSIQQRVKCGTIIHIGDLVDNHTVSMNYTPDPNGKSPKDEILEARKHLKYWYRHFPDIKLCLGNHDMRVDLKGRHVGLPDEVFRPFRAIWELPDSWQDAFSWEIDGVRYTHGTGLSGDTAHIKAAQQNRQSTVIGHTHSVSATQYLVSEKDRIMAMNVGCGVDRHSYAMAYGRDFTKKPVLSCGVVTDKGRYCQVFPMEI